jgi:hypothetical protein
LFFQFTLFQLLDTGTLKQFSCSLFLPYEPLEPRKRLLQGILIL